ncbi:Uncharacterised protein [uncultured archaeon]|nr:Uncharacterised protein [uncultured archaeon]
MKWQTKAGNAENWIEWGRQPYYGDGREKVNSSADGMASYLLQNVTTATRIYYRVTSGPDLFEGSFISPPAASSDSLLLYAYGNTRGGALAQSKVAEKLLSNAGTNIFGRPPILIHTGNVVDGALSESDWGTQAFSTAYPPLESLRSRIPAAYAVGSRDAQDGAAPLYGKYLAPASSGRYYNSFDWGPAHFIILDPYTAPIALGSPEYLWLEHDLAGSRKSWKIVVLNPTIYGAGGSADYTLENVLPPLFERTGVDLVLQDNNAYYSRAVVNGLTYVVTGGGGATLEAPSDGVPQLLNSSKANHFVKCDAAGDTLDCQAISDVGTVLDEFEVRNRE